MNTMSKGVGNVPRYVKYLCQDAVSSATCPEGFAECFQLLHRAKLWCDNDEVATKHYNKAIAYLHDFWFQHDFDDGDGPIDRNEMRKTLDEGVLRRHTKNDEQYLRIWVEIREGLQIGIDRVQWNLAGPPEHPVNPFPGYSTCEYLYLLETDIPIEHRVEQFKQLMKDRKWSRELLCDALGMKPQKMKTWLGSDLWNSLIS